MAMHDRKGNTQLHYAAYGGDPRLVKALATPEMINLRNENGETAVLLAYKNGYLEAGLELVRLGADIDIKNLLGKCARDYMPD